MKPLFKTIIKPLGERYNNSKGDLILNANISIKDHQYVNRVGEVIENPVHNPLLKKGDKVIVHPNVFRKYWGFSTHLRTSSSDLDDGTFAVNPDSIYAYNRNGSWIPLRDTIFIEPTEGSSESLILSLDKYKQRIGKVYLGGSKCLSEGDTVSFTPYSEHEFIIDGVRVYRMRERDITAKIL